MKHLLPAMTFSLLMLVSAGVHAQAANTTYQSGDLLALHWDAFPDYDDLQAMIATRELLDERGNVQTLVVLGTTGNFANSVNILEGSFEHASTLFGNIIDARRKNWSGTSETVASRWRTTLEAGGTVHVAEGGPSDFTALVINSLRRQGVSGLNRIRVVQHSQNANERTTGRAAINTVRSATTYVNIDDGNSLNGTSGFNGVVATRAQRDAFMSQSLASEYGSQWSVAYSYVNPQTSPRVIDFSDFVEVMHIMGVPMSEIPTITAFANRFFNSGGQSATPAPTPVQTPAPSVDTSTPIAVVGSSAAAARQAFLAQIGSAALDCDPVGDGRWVCANFPNPQISDVAGAPAVSTPGPIVEAAPVAEPAPVSVLTPAAPVSNSDGGIAVVGDTLEQAKAAYDASISLPRADCDEAADGRWVCASFNNPQLSDVGEASTVSTDRYAVVGASLQEAQSQFAAVASAVRVDCDPVGDGRWVCANFSNPTLADVSN